MGRPKAMEMLCFGKKINAPEAKERNLVSCIYPHQSFQSDVQVSIDIDSVIVFVHCVIS